MLRRAHRLVEGCIERSTPLFPDEVGVEAGAPEKTDQSDAGGAQASDEPAQSREIDATIAVHRRDRKGR
ncbi:hypothetical protein [Methylobacterium ajmalii]|uniref:hypothetical protein n=1 Tax=Methylobacterium TaxID=407 RepID=UPI0038B39C2E